MTWVAPDVERIYAPRVADERPMLQGWLDFHRTTLLWKCRGLTGEQLKLASAEPSNLTLLGLVRHMAEVERWWFRIRAAEQDVGTLYCPDESPDGDFDDIADADPSHDFAAFLAEVAEADKAVADLPLEHTFLHPRHESEFSLRWVYTHMIEEYARHNGHADLIRERLDGATGQ